MKVKHYMTKEVITATSDVKISNAVDIMEEHDFHRLPIVDQGKFVGLITEEMIAKNSPSKVSSLSIYEMNYLFDKVLIKDLMEKNVRTIDENVLLEEAALIMTDNDITVLPVLNKKNEIIGIITHKDIFKALIELTGYKDEGSRIVVITPQDRLGILAQISKALADHAINLTHIFVNRPEDVIEITLQTTGINSKMTQHVLENIGYKTYEII